MKTRIDFVSNSSSCSFVVSCKKEFLKDIAKDLARACMNKKDPYHDKELGKKNQLILDFCLKTFQLAFLGELLLETREETYSLDYFKQMLAKYSNAKKDYAEFEWNSYKEKLKEIKSGKQIPDWILREYGLDEYDATTDTAKHYEKVFVKDVVVSNFVMESRFNRYHLSNSIDESEDTIKERVESLIEFAREKTNKDSGASKDFFESIDIYQITKDTIDNTRDLISYGHTIYLGKWEDLDELSARLDSGDAIFYVRIAHSGDGYGDFYIYCEDEADGLDGVSGVEILASDSL